MLIQSNPVSRLILGTAQFGLPYGVANKSGQIDRSAAKTMLQLAAAHGIELLDTAIAYGESEERLGEIGIEEFDLISKLPEVPVGTDNLGKWVCEQSTASLGRLGVNGLFGLLLHRPLQLLEPYGAALYEALQNQKENGLVRKIGISIYSPGELNLLIPKFEFDIVQLPFNLVDRRLLSLGWLSLLKDRGVEIHARSAFLQGLLLMDRDCIPDRFSKWSDMWCRWEDWLSYHKVSGVEACLAFPLGYPEIDRVVVGADSVSQLEQIIEAANSEFPFNFPDIQSDDENLICPARW